MSENVLLYKTTFAECIIMHSLISLNFVPWVGSATNDWPDRFVVSLVFMRPSLTFQYLFVSFRSFFLSLRISCFQLHGCGGGKMGKSSPSTGRQPLQAVL